MSMKHCPICGEDYSDTYSSCPFCEEEKAMREGAATRRSGKRSSKRSRQFSLITPTLIVLIVIMAGLLIYLLYGDRIAEKFSKGDGDEPPTETVIPEKPDEQDQEDEEEPDDEMDEPAPGVMPESPDADSDNKHDSKPDKKPDSEPDKKPDAKPDKKPADKSGYEKAAALPDGITLSMTDFTVKVAGESHVIKATGGSGSYHWYSENPDVASVDANGKVTALSKGTVTIVATDGSKKGECVVRVNVANTTPVTAPSETQTSTSAKLNKEDFTTSVGEPDVKLTVSGAGGQVTWRSTDPGIATVSADGVVKAVGKGTTTIQAKVNGATLSCIVRVK